MAGANKLALKVDKANLAIFHAAQSSLNDSINVKTDNQYLKQLKYVKFLGFLLDEKPSWNYHLSELFKKLKELVE